MIVRNSNHFTKPDHFIDNSMFIFGSTSIALINSIKRQERGEIWNKAIQKLTQYQIIDEIYGEMYSNVLLRFLSILVTLQQCKCRRDNNTNSHVLHEDGHSKCFLYF